ncbi:MAG: fibrillarin-like rRNA/tRNA 2'-O-methyltransferase [Thaumarchaeota archaeon]|nr:fibrillarin-like rRNA/tRNA 2'-O-methyltransferase [Nitrososphaerota archaeon]
MTSVRADEERPGLYWADLEGRRLPATKNLAPGISVYGEQLLSSGGVEYRLWDPYRSKLAGAILNGLRGYPFGPGRRVLYLGASTGTTVSHISDIVEASGTVFAVEISQRVARELLDRVVKHRPNVIPILEDARRPERYGFVYGKVDVEYCDVAQQDQTEIAISNARRYLREGGDLLLVVKTRSIDVTKEPEEVIRGEVAKLKPSGFEVLQVVNLEPYDRDHALVHARLTTSEH